MIIQHNIMSLNAHRQLGGNTNKVSKNLEKLSSGYKINRAGDDAAGLAISEKMRAQITGLTRAQSNAQDGISLVQTAEGALTEVHSMLNRMVDLATQSSNGTMQGDDRQKIQDEINSLTGEIDRISQSTNFNGINLLDGSLGGGGRDAKLAAARIAGADIGTIATVAPTKNLYAAGTIVDKTNTGAEVKYKDANGKDKVASVTFTAGGSATATGDALVAALNKDADFSKLFKATNASGQIRFEAVKAGTGKGSITSAATTGGTPVANILGANTVAADQVMTATGAGDLAAGDSFTVNGKTFEFVLAGGNATKKGAIAVEVAAADADTVANLNKALDDAGTGTMVTAAGNVYSFTKNTAAASGGLTLQIGDTADEFNKVTVSVSNMGTAGLGIDAIDVGEQGVAADSIASIKSAIESVSINRSAMGALQNRLEHTINNLGVATENMTAAESRIRDVDMAKEMADFTKNNVLTQAAQAMLAQANQQPQQVLQLLR